MEENRITYFAKTNFRNKETKFGMKKKDRTRHTYIIGKTGTGKTTLQENMAIQDIRAGEGLAVIDPHGSFVEKMLDYIPEERIKDVVYFDPSDLDNPIALNIMEDVDGDQLHLVASGLMGVFKKMWPDVWSARMEYILNNTLLALLEYPNATLLGVNRMFSDKDYRKAVVDNVKDPIVKDFWVKEYAGYTERFAAEATPAIQNKIGQFTSNPLVRNIIGQPKSSFSFRRAMDEKKIVLINLSKGRIGELNSSLLGALLVTKIYLASMSRAKEPHKTFPDFYFYVDEFQNFAAESFENILSESRKYGLALVLAHQYIAQMPEGVRDAVFGNVGTQIVFRVGPADAMVLETEFTPEFLADDIVNLGFTNIYLKLLIDGEPSRPFSASTLPPLEKNEVSFKEEIIKNSRKLYCSTVEEIDEAIREWHEPIKVEKRDSDFAEQGKKDDGGYQEAPDKPKLFEANCSVCGKKTVVPFQPDESRPIYCKKHRAYATEAPSSFSQPKPTPTSTSTLKPETSELELKKSTPTPRPTPATPQRPQRTTSSHTYTKPKPRREYLDTKKVSLSELDKKTSGFKNKPSFTKPREDKKRKEKGSPDFKGLRELLAEVSKKEVTEKVEKKPTGPVFRENKESPSKTFKPGDTIKF